MNDIKYDERYEYAIGKGLLCETHIYGNFTNGALYPINWQIRGTSKNKYWCDPYIIDNDGDNMPIKFIINKSTKFKLVNIK